MSAALEISRELIRFKSETPSDGGSLAYIKDLLTPLGFICHNLPFEDTNNLVAVKGSGSPHFSFAGHVDVVPALELEKWQALPFHAEVIEGKLFGRGACDMKGSIGAFLAALQEFNSLHTSGTISLILTSDEEGTGANGTKRLIPWMKENEIVPDFCLVGEPTSNRTSGDTIKVGRRGSLTTHVTCSGTAGHVAYPEKATNPISSLTAFLNELLTSSLDEGHALFDPSNLEITTIDVANGATNVIPAKATASFNIRFNPHHTTESLVAWIQEKSQKHKGTFLFEFEKSGDPFYCESKQFIKLMEDATKSILGEKPTLSTSGGTSDARFLHHLCPVIECGLPNETIHQTNEHVLVEDIDQLKKIYQKTLEKFFS